MILDRFVCDPDAAEVHSRFIPAPPAQVYRALKELRPSELSPFVGALMAIRAIPGWLFGPRNPHDQKRQDLPMLEGLAQQGFVMLADTPEEIVFGLIAKVWQLVSPEFAAIACPDEFLAFGDASMAKVACNMTINPFEGGTMLTTETRVRVADAKARKAFLRYWFAIRMGSGLIRRLWLRAVAKRVAKVSPELKSRATPAHAQR